MPLPVPLLPLVTVIQLVLLLTPVQPQPLDAVTADDCDPPAALTFWVVGATVKLQTARLRHGHRLAGDRQGADTRAGRIGRDGIGHGAGPVPLLPLVTEIQDVLLLTAVQPQPLVVLTVAFSEPPAAVLFTVVHATANVHMPACVTVTVWSAIVNVPVREPVAVLARDGVIDRAVAGAAAAARDGDPAGVVADAGPAAAARRGDCG